jgi:hypothetical protein
MGGSVEEQFEDSIRFSKVDEIVKILMAKRNQID